jgi:DNA-binding MarR family transcriptional regulator
MSKELAAEMASDCLASRVRRLERTVSRIYDGALRGAGITAPQLSMLAAVELAGPTTAAFVGKLLDLEKSTVSRNLARLVALGLIETDGSLRITSRGSATIRECHPLWRRAQQQLREALGPRELELLAALEPPIPRRSSHGKRRNVRE